MGLMVWECMVGNSWGVGARPMKMYEFGLVNFLDISGYISMYISMGIYVYIYGNTQVCMYMYVYVWVYIYI